MADLREQMLKAGLISEKEAKRADHQQRQRNKQVPREERERQVRAGRDEARQQRDAQAKSDRDRNRERQKAVEEKAQDHQATQRKRSATDSALRDGELARWSGRRRYHFVDGKRIEFILVSDEAAGRLEKGAAAIARDAGGYKVIVAAAALKLAETQPDRVVVFHRD